MNQQLREIVNRRNDLAFRAERERRELAENYIWSSGAIVIAGHLLNAGQAIRSHSSILGYAGKIIISVSPITTLKWAGRIAMLLMELKRIRKKFRG